MKKDKKKIEEVVPKTIKELEKWYKDHDLPEYEKSKIFIGEEYKDLKAYGVYKDSKTGKYVVFQNKGGGLKDTYYEGDDEEFAVNKVYERVREKYIDKKKKKTNSGLFIYGTVITMAIFFFIFYAIITLVILGPKRGYYLINDNEYYYINGWWYTYGNDDWYVTSEPKHSRDIKHYYVGDEYKDNWRFSDFRRSKVYKDKWD